MNLNSKDGPNALPNPQTANPSTLHLIQPSHAPSTLQFRIFESNSEQCLDGRPTEHITNHDSIVEGRCPAFRILSSCVMSLGHTHPHTPGLTLGKGGFSFVDREWEDANDCSLVRQKRSWFLPCDFEDLKGLYFLQRSYNHIAKLVWAPFSAVTKV